MDTKLIKSMAEQLIRACTSHEGTKALFAGIESELTNEQLEKDINWIEGVGNDIAKTIAKGLEERKAAKQLASFFANKLNTPVEAVAPTLERQLENTLG